MKYDLLSNVEDVVKKAGKDSLLWEKLSKPDLLGNSMIRDCIDKINDTDFPELDGLRCEAVNGLESEEIEIRLINKQGNHFVLKIDETRFLLYSEDNLLKIFVPFSNSRCHEVRYVCGNDIIVYKLVSDHDFNLEMKFYTNVVDEVKNNDVDNLLTTLIPDSTALIRGIKYDLGKVSIGKDTWFDNIFGDISNITGIIGISLNDGRRISNRVYAEYKSYCDSIASPKKL